MIKGAMIGLFITLIVTWISLGLWFSMNWAEQWDIEHVKGITLIIPATVDLYTNTTVFPIDNYTIRSVEIRQNEIRFELSYIED